MISLLCLIYTTQASLPPSPQVFGIEPKGSLLTNQPLSEGVDEYSPERGWVKPESTSKNPKGVLAKKSSANSLSQVCEDGSVASADKGKVNRTVKWLWAQTFGRRNGGSRLGPSLSSISRMVNIRRRNAKEAMDSKEVQDGVSLGNSLLSLKVG